MRSYLTHVFSLFAVSCVAACGSDSSSSSSGGSPAGDASSAASATSSFACASQTCEAPRQYCGELHDEAKDEWYPQGCSTVPAACASSSDVCACLARTAGCDTVHCEDANGQVSFGCN